MIRGLGIDLVEIQSVVASLDSEAFTNKVFTPAEVAACRVYGSPAEHFAGKFAAKEAFMKAIGQGIRQEIWFSQIEVLNDPQGKPYIVPSGRAAEALKAQGVQAVHLSLSHTANLAVAVVILE
jgi:holo-[acyl-carrier protein] synthase